MQKARIRTAIPLAAMAVVFVTGGVADARQVQVTPAPGVTAVSGRKAVRPPVVTPVVLPPVVTPPGVTPPVVVPPAPVTGRHAPHLPVVVAL